MFIMDGTEYWACFLHQTIVCTLFQYLPTANRILKNNKINALLEVCHDGGTRYRFNIHVYAYHVSTFDCLKHLILSAKTTGLWLTVDVHH